MKEEGFDLKVGRRGPDKLLTTFSKTPFWLWVTLSLIVHFSITGFVSYGFIRDHYLDPEGAVARKAAAAAAAAAAQPKPVTPPPAPVKPPVTTPTNTAVNPLEAHKDAPVVKRITETTPPTEIPQQPGDLGISLEDTKLK